MFVLEKVKKIIFKTTSMLVLANQKVFWKNTIFFNQNGAIDIFDADISSLCGKA